MTTTEKIRQYKKMMQELRDLGADILYNTSQEDYNQNEAAIDQIDVLDEYMDEAGFFFQKY